MVGGSAWTHVKCSHTERVIFFPLLHAHLGIQLGVLHLRARPSGGERARGQAGAVLAAHLVAEWGRGRRSRGGGWRWARERARARGEAGCRRHAWRAQAEGTDRCEMAQLVARRFRRLRRVHRGAVSCHRPSSTCTGIKRAHAPFERLQACCGRGAGGGDGAMPGRHSAREERGAAHACRRQISAPPWTVGADGEARLQGRLPGRRATNTQTRQTKKLCF